MDVRGSLAFFVSMVKKVVMEKKRFDDSWFVFVFVFFLLFFFSFPKGERGLGKYYYPRD